ncbi:MAG: hypothetical protein JSS53_02495 [Proteobacteria bacterium]|nr:hypothetical protein [Pseudomonadota bacterium]
MFCVDIAIGIVQEFTALSDNEKKELRVAFTSIIETAQYIFDADYENSKAPNLDLGLAHDVSFQAFLLIYFGMCCKLRSTQPKLLLQDIINYYGLAIVFACAHVTDSDYPWGLIFKQNQYTVESLGNREKCCELNKILFCETILPDNFQEEINPEKIYQILFSFKNNSIWSLEPNTNKLCPRLNIPREFLIQFLNLSWKKYPAIILQAFITHIDACLFSGHVEKAQELIEFFIESNIILYNSNISNKELVKFAVENGINVDNPNKILAQKFLESRIHHVNNQLIKIPSDGSENFTKILTTNFQNILLNLKVLGKREPLAKKMFFSIEKNYTPLLTWIDVFFINARNMTEALFVNSIFIALLGTLSKMLDVLPETLPEKPKLLNEKSSIESIYCQNKDLPLCKMLDSFLSDINSWEDHFGIALIMCEILDREKRQLYLNKFHSILVTFIDALDYSEIYLENVFYLYHAIAKIYSEQENLILKNEIINLLINKIYGSINSELGKLLKESSEYIKTICTINDFISYYVILKNGSCDFISDLVNLLCHINQKLTGPNKRGELFYFLKYLNSTILADTISSFKTLVSNIENIILRDVQQDPISSELICQLKTLKFNFYTICVTFLNSHYYQSFLEVNDIGFLLDTLMLFPKSFHEKNSIPETLREQQEKLIRHGAHELIRLSDGKNQNDEDATLYTTLLYKMTYYLNSEYPQELCHELHSLNINYQSIIQSRNSPSLCA